jgi:hypothetical protein
MNKETITKANEYIKDLKFYKVIKDKTESQIYLLLIVFITQLHIITLSTEYDFIYTIKIILLLLTALVIFIITKCKQICKEIEAMKEEIYLKVTNENN